MRRIVFSAYAILLMFAVGCSKDGDKKPDTEYPVIDLTQADAFPKQCSELMRGQKFYFKARLSDNVELGSYSLDIHHNFDHHTHSTEVNDCAMESIKQPVKPFLLIKSYPVPQGQKIYNANTELEVPADVDPGDYHFLIRVTDKEGWQTIKGISIKIK